LISFVSARFYSLCPQTLNTKANKKNCNQNLYNLIKSLFATKDFFSPVREGVVSGVFTAMRKSV